MQVLGQDPFDMTGSDLLGVPSPVDDEVLFGKTVVLSSFNGTRMAVGAPSHDYQFPAGHPDFQSQNSGAIFLYELSYNKKWYRLWFLSGNTNESLGEFFSLSGDGSRIAVRRNVVFDGPSTVEIYDISPLGQSTLVGSPVSCSSVTAGKAVTLSSNGNRLAVSCEDPGSNRGTVEIFDWDGQVWSSTGTVGNNVDNGRFGFINSFSSDGERLAVSAPSFSNDTQIGLGLVQVFDFIHGSWVQAGNDIVGENIYHQLGSAMALSGDGSTLIVSSPSSPDSSGRLPLCGRVQRFGLSSEGTWVQQGSTIYGDTRDLFGQSVAVSYNGFRIAASSYLRGMLRGQVRVFDFTDGDWVVHGKPIDGSNVGDQLGYGRSSISLTRFGEFLGIGSPTFQSTGKVSVYRIESEPHNNDAPGDHIPIEHNATSDSSPPAAWLPETVGPTSRPTLTPLAESPSSVFLTQSPTKTQPTLSPTSFNGTTNWTIDFQSATVHVDTTSAAGQQEVTLAFLVSRPHIVNAAVYHIDCSTPINASMMTVRYHLQESSLALDQIDVSLAFHLPTVVATENSVYTPSSSKTSGRMSLCVHVQLYDDQDTATSTILHFKQQIFYIKTDGLSITGIDMDASSVDDVNAEKNPAGLDHAVTACQCNRTNHCQSIIVSPDSPVRICLTSNAAGVSIARLNELELQQGSLSQPVVENGLADLYTTVFHTESQSLVMETILSSAAFFQPVPSSLMVSGSCDLQRGDSDNRSLLRRSLYYSAVDPAQIASVSFRVPIELSAWIPNESEAVESASSVEPAMKVILSASLVGALTLWLF